VLVWKMPLPEMPAEAGASISRRREGSGGEMKPDTGTFLCNVCKRPTTHELSEDHTRARCTVCAAKQKNQRNLKLQADADAEKLHVAALDGPDYSGTNPQRRKAK
jgi:hypothetical protein